VEHLMLHEQLFVALASLQPQQRELLQKGYVEQLSLTNIARTYGITKQSVFDRLTKIECRIKKNFV
jgi:predicted DNA-binding protein YlxM (UPF0122 family)